MAAQTITTTVNFDSPSVLGLLNGEAITVNGGALTIDSDVRWNQNAAVLGSITVSSTLGGSVLFDGSKVWELRYTAATGNVPAQAALGSNGVTGGTSGATGELLRVWGSGLEPLAAGGAMPATGWVKLRSKTGNFQAGEVVTLPGGATITISSPGKRSWLHIVGAENGTLTIPRLGDVKFRGEWYELGTTNGSDDQTFQFPVADACPAIWIEKYAGAYNLLGEFGLEPWLAAGDRWGTATPFVAQDVRGKYFGQDLATGVITIARRASNACGFKPAAGLKVFVPNLILSSSTSANWAANTINATITTRYEIATTAAGTVDVVGVSSSWYFNCASPVSASVKRSGFLEAVRVVNCAKTWVLEDVGVGLRSATAAQTALTTAQCLSGGNMLRVRLSRSVQGVVWSALDMADVQGTDVQIETFGASGSTLRSAAVTALQLLRSVRITLNGLSLLGARANPASVSGLTINGLAYADNLIGETQVANALSPVTLDANCTGVDVSGCAPFGGLAGVLPYSTWIAGASGNTDVTLRDIGTPASPLDADQTNRMQGAISGVTFNGLTVRRVYMRNLRSKMLTVGNDSQNMTLVNVWGDGGTQQDINATNSTVRGCRFGQWTGAYSAVYGCHWQDFFVDDTSGRFVITCQEPTDATAGQCVTSFAPGSGFTGAGSVSMANAGDYVEWVMPYFALGHTALANVAPTVSGTNVANHALQFQADTGSGWSAWADLTGPNLAAVGAINPATGIKLKVRATVTVASTSNLLTFIRIDTVTDATSQQVQYPLPGVLTTLAAQVPLTGAEVRVYDLDNSPAGSLGTELAGTESAGSTFSFDATPGNLVWLQVMAPGFEEYGQRFTVPANDTTLSLILTPELNT